MFLIISVSSACLITNCPRGGKRNYEEAPTETQNVGKSFGLGYILYTLIFIFKL